MTAPSAESTLSSSSDAQPASPQRPEKESSSAQDAPHTWAFVGWLYLISWALQGVVIAQGGLAWANAQPMLAALMFTPALLTLFALWRSATWSQVAWGIRRPQYLLYGALIPAGLALLCVGAISLLGWGTPSHWSVTGEGLVIEKGGFVLGQGAQGWAFFGLNYVLSALAFSVLNGVAAFGEELGWRGYLQDRFVRRYGRPLGITALGLVWGFWHFPLVLLAGYNYPETPVLGAVVLFPATAVLASFFLAWLTTRAKSFWPAVLAHGSVNTFFGYIVSGMAYAGEDARLFSDILILAFWGLVALVSFKAAARYTTREA